MSSADVKLMPWANGRGVTRELVRRETADGRLICRLSIADVVEPGEFSRLPGIDRVLTLISGAGFGLTIDGAPTAVERYQPLRFSGDAPAAATAVAGPSRDFNVMVDRATARAEVTVHRGSFTTIACDFSYYLIVEGTWLVPGACQDLLGSLSWIAVERAAGQPTEFIGSGVVIAVHVSLLSAKAEGVAA